MRKLASLRPDVPVHSAPGRTKRNSRRFNRTRAVALRERLVEAMRADESLCEHCAMEGREFRSGLRVECHHLRPRKEFPELTYRLGNLQFLCGKHHNLRTQLEMVNKSLGRWVVTGKPGYGKSTLVQRLAKNDALIWDADVVASSLGYPAFPRTEAQEHHLRKLRKEWIARAMKTPKESWLIARWPTPAYCIAIRMGAQVVELVKPAWIQNHERFPPGIDVSRLHTRLCVSARVSAMDC